MEKSEKLDETKLNILVDKCRKEIKSLKYADLIKQVSSEYLDGISYVPIEDKNIFKIPCDGKEALSLATEFYSKFDYDIYKDISAIILNNSKIKTAIYTDKTEDMLLRDRIIHQYPKTAKLSMGILEFTTKSKKIPFIDFAEIYVPLRNDLISDFITIVHELAHSLDLNTELGTNDNRNILCEAISQAFERFGAQYLIAKRPELSKEIYKKLQYRNGIVKFDAAKVYVMFKLAEIKDKEKRNITVDDLENICNESKFLRFDNNKRILKRKIFDFEHLTLNYTSRYFIGNLIATHMAKLYKENPEETVEMLKKYCSSVKNNLGIENALNCLGISQHNYRTLFAEKNDEIKDLYDSVKQKRSTFEER